MNLYRGCTHGCIYCDSRSRCYQMDHDFEDIEVKVNSLDLLERALSGKRSKCMIGTGSMSDPYMHIEADLQYTRKALQLINRYHFGATLITKSDMVLRDLDLLTEINSKTKAVVQMTLTTYDDKLSAVLEPGAPVTSRRYQVLKELQSAGIPTAVWLCPILPFINDTPENINGILDYCFDAGVRGIICFGMGVTLRDGNREYFYRQLDRHFPGLKARYIKDYGCAYQLSSPRHAKLTDIFERRCREQGVIYHPDRVFDWIYQYEDKTAGEQIRLF